jgi:hypothetical protein
MSWLQRRSVMGRVSVSVLMLNSLAACGGSDSTGTAPTPSVTATPLPMQPPLVSLTVSPLILRPAFSPAISDYAVACSAGTNTLTLGMTAIAGGAVSLLQPFATAWAPSVSVPVSLAEDQAAVVLARDATGATLQYWIRCLPHDFPLVTPSSHPEVGSPTGI